MESQIKGLVKGLHHVTATVNEAQEDYDFYTKLLGLRLVKETVNFDNEAVYHFYYGNKIGSPATIFTTFPYKNQGVRVGTIGTGQVFRTSFAIPSSSESFWKNRLIKHGVSFTEAVRFGSKVIIFEDPSGLKLDFTIENDHRGDLWATDDISVENSIRGIHSVTLLVENHLKTGEFLEWFGYRKTAEDQLAIQFEAGMGGSGNTVILQKRENESKGINGLGTVHHVAHRVGTFDDAIKIKELVEARGLKVTEVKDRKYFKSIYFRIPGGVLFEVATSEPGFLIDEAEDELGTSLKLPDWQEPNRQRIESNLTPYTK